MRGSPSRTARMPNDPCQLESNAYATAAGEYVDAGAEAAIQYAESLTATAYCDSTWQTFLQAEWNLDYCRAINGYGASSEREESPKLVAARATLAKLNEARNALSQYHADRLNDCLATRADTLTDAQRAKIQNALEVLQKAMK